MVQLEDSTWQVPESTLSRLSFLRARFRNWAKLGLILSPATRTIDSAEVVPKNGGRWTLSGIADDKYYLWSMLNLWQMARVFDYNDFEKDLDAIEHVGSDIHAKLKEALNRGLPQVYKSDIGYSCIFGFFFVRLFKPVKVIETGVDNGNSSYFFLKALELNGGNGTLTSIDYPNRNCPGQPQVPHEPSLPYEFHTGWLVPESLRKNWDLKLGKSEDILPNIPEIFDFFQHDSLHSYEHMTFEFEWALKQMSNRGVIMSDDASSNSAFGDFVAKHNPILHVLARWKSSPCAVILGRK